MQEGTKANTPGVGMRDDPSSPRRYSISARLLPILYFEIYLNFTVVLFAYGPWPWPVTNPEKLYGFLGMAHLALFLGYALAVLRRPAVYVGKWTPNGIVKTSLLVSAMLLLPTISFRTGSVIPDVRAALANLGSAYEETNRLREQGTPLIEYVRIVFAPWLFWLFPLALFY